MDEKVLTIKQLAEALQVTEQHLYRELREPDCKIPVSMIGTSKRFILSEVLKATSCNIFDKYVNAFEAARNLIEHHVSVSKRDDDTMALQKYRNAVELLEIF